MKGFTLIEVLLVVIIVAMMALMVLLGLNPMEQVKKARDSGKLSKAKEAVTAAEGYFVFNHSNPACADLIATEQLKPDSCDGISLVVVSDGVYQVEFNPESQTYIDLCGGDGVCTIPDELL